MYSVNLIKPAKQKKALLKNSKNLKQMSDMYYEQSVFVNRIKDRSYKKTYYVHNVSEIFNKFNIGSSNELLFLLHRACGNNLGECEYCGLIKSTVKTRSGFNTIDCAHTGICVLCKKPSRSINDNKVCHFCVYENKNENHINERYLFLQAAGDHRYITTMRENGDIEKLKIIREVASQYVNWFDELIYNLTVNKH